MPVMSKLKKIYEYIDSLYPMYGDNGNIKNYVRNVIDEYRWGEKEAYLYFVNLISKTTLYKMYEMSDVTIENIDKYIEGIKKNCKDIITKYTNSYETYKDKEILLQLAKITYLKDIWHPYTKQSINKLWDILLYSIYLTYNKL